MTTNRDILQQASQCSMDDLVGWINDMKSKIKLLEEVKRVRIKDGEKTSAMIKRDQKKQQKSKQRQTQPANQGQVTQ